MSALVPEYFDRNTAANTLATVYAAASRLVVAAGQNASGADAYMQVWDGNPAAAGVLLYTMLTPDKGSALVVCPGADPKLPGRPISTDLRVGWSSTEHTFTGALGRLNVYSYNVYP